MKAGVWGQLYLAGEDCLWWGCGVNAGGLDGDDKVAAVFEEVLCVDAHNTGLVWLCHICSAGSPRQPKFRGMQQPTERVFSDSHQNLDSYKSFNSTLHMPHPSFSATSLDPMMVARETERHLQR